MPSAASLTVLPNYPFEVKPLLVTQAANTWAQEGLKFDRTQVLIDPRSNAEKKSFPIAMTLTRDVKNKQQRILVVGDADFINNAELIRQSPRTSNFSVMTDLFRWFSNDQFPINTNRPEPTDVVKVTASQLNYIRWGWLVLLPIGIAGAVTTFLIRRKRR
jgi:ABC-2 type transport system permease protein